MSETLYRRRPASNRMPPAVRGHVGVIGWTVLAACAIGVVWLGAVDRSALVVFSLIAVATGAGALLDGRSRRRTAAQRGAESICTFARSFDTRTTDTWVLRAVYEELERVVHFPIRPQDRLRDDMRFHDDDVEDLILAIADRAGRSVDDCDRNPFFNRLHTVADLVQFLVRQPKLQPAPWG